VEFPDPRASFIDGAAPCADGQVVHDGPFAETKEQLAGVYLVEAESMAEAKAWARKIPQVVGGKVEVRELVNSPSRGAT
jgi:hypothetical protein